MTYETLRYDVVDHVLTLTLARPDQWNTVTDVMLEELIAAFETADSDPDVRVIILTGSGKAFCAGADVSGGADAFDAGERGWANEIDDFRDGGGRLALAIFNCRKPVIGAVNGVAAGLGATMLLPMDIVLASHQARIGFVFTKRGLVPEACASWFLPRRVGMGIATEWCFTGRVVAAQEALDAGLFRSVHSPDELLGAANDLAREIADNASPVAVGIVRQMLWRFTGSEHPMDAHRVDSRIGFHLGKSPDVAEGVSAFLEKRAPRFPGVMPGDEPPTFPWWTEPDFLADEKPNESLTNGETR